jgi:hypothetical protein
MFVIGPIVALALIAGMLAIAVGVLVPLLPLLLLALIIWSVVRATSRPAVVAR